jgi:hypothetical protein
MSVPTTSDTERYADIVTQEPERFSTGKIVATLVGMLLIGLMLAVMTQGLWVPWIGR